jgi:hypothetical protein
MSGKDGRTMEAVVQDILTAQTFASLSLLRDNGLFKGMMGPWEGIKDVKTKCPRPCGYRGGFCMPINL